MKKYILAIISLIISGSFLSFKSNSLNGIDISHHNTINWNKIQKTSEIKFVYIKATEGKSFIDKSFQNNAKSANSIGLHVGAYHYFRTDVSGEAQFKNFSKQLDKIKFDLIPAIDIEAQNNNFQNQEEVEKQLSILINSIHKKYGVYPILYIGSRKALFTLSKFYYCRFWIRTMEYSKYLPDLTIKQIGYTKIGNQIVDADYCSNLSQIIIKH